MTSKGFFFHQFCDMAIERILTKAGTIIYRDTNTGKFAKRSSWSRQAYESIKMSDFEGLNTKEKLSIRANQRIRNNGKFLDNRQARRIKDTLNKTGQKLQNNDLTKTFGKEAAMNILTTTFTRWVNSDPKNQFNVEREIIKALKQGLEFTFVHKGKKYIGMDALFKLQEVEAAINSKLQKEGKSTYPLLYKIKEDENGNLLIDSEETEIIS